MQYQSHPFEYEPISRSRPTALSKEQDLKDGLSLVDTERPETTPDSGQESSISQTTTSSLLAAQSVISSRKRGHTFSYIGLFLFTVVLYFRPYEYISFLSSFTSMAFWIAVITVAAYIPTQLSLEGNLTARPREVLFALCLLLAGFLSIPFADQDRYTAYDTFMDMFIRAIAMFIILVNVVRTEQRLRWLMMVSLGVAVYLAVNALHDYSTGNLAVEGYRVKGALNGMFGNPNDMSQHLVSMVPVAVAFLCTSRGIVRRIFFAVSVLVLVGGIVVTFSRGGFLALMMITLVLAWKLGKHHRSLFMTLALAGCLGFVAAAPSNYRSRLLSIFDNSLEVASGSAESRRDLLKESVKVALRHPVLGIGMGNFRLIYKLMTHNAYTQIAAEMGLFGFTAYLLFIITPLKRLLEIEHATNSDPTQRRFYFMSVCLQAMLVGYMVSSFFGAVAYYYNVYYLVGYAVSLRMIYYSTIGLPHDAPSLLRTENEETKPSRIDAPLSHVVGIAPTVAQVKQV